MSQRQAGSITKSVVIAAGSEGDQSQAAAAKVEGLALARCSSREPELAGGEDV